jgi:hypothetical protein
MSAAAKEAHPRRLRVICLHGWRTSADIMKIQLRNFPKEILEMHFLNGAHDAKGFV